MNGGKKRSVRYQQLAFPAPHTRYVRAKVIAFISMHIKSSRFGVGVELIQLVSYIIHHALRFRLRRELWISLASGMQKAVSARPEEFSAMVHTRRIPNPAPLFLGSKPIVRQDPNLHLKMPISSISLDRTYRERRPCSGVAWRR